MYHVHVETINFGTIIVPKSKLIIHKKNDNCFIEIGEKTYAITEDEAECLIRQIDEVDEELSEAICKFRNSFDQDSVTHLKVCTL